MLFALDALVIIILLIIITRSVIKAFRTRVVRSADLICVMIFVFYALPLVYDWFLTIGPPDHLYVPWISHRVRVVYNWIILFSVIFLKLGAYRRKSHGVENFRNEGFSLVPMRPTGAITSMVVLSWLVLLLPPLIVILLSPQPSAYLSYGGGAVGLRAAGKIDRWMAFTINIISMTCLLALLGFFIIYWVRMRISRSAFDPQGLIALLLVFIAVYIQGKRSGILFLFIIIGVVNFLERKLKLRTVVVLCVALLAISYAYIGSVKGYERSFLAFLRGDLARDYTLRHAIYKSNWTKSSIVPYRGSTYVFVMGAYIPRSKWTRKPWPAPVYLTNDIVGETSSRYIGYGFGMGFMEELIMNFGYIGTIGCFLIGRFARWLDSFIYSRSSYYAVLWLPMVFGCVFASSVVLKLIIVMILPALFFSRIFASPKSWIPLYDESYCQGYGPDEYNSVDGYIDHQQDSGSSEYNEAERYFANYHDY